MRIIIKTKNFEPTEELQKFIDKKFLPLKKFIDILKDDTPERGKTLAEVFIELERETKHHKNGDIFVAELQVRLPGKSIVAKSRTDDLFKSLIEARDELKLEIEKYKFKKIDKNRRQQKKYSQSLR